jgi:hypothetical protein
MYASYPPEIRSWIDNRGGPDKLKVETFWFMHSHDLWAIGYPRCLRGGGRLGLRMRGPAGGGWREWVR